MTTLEIINKLLEIDKVTFYLTETNNYSNYQKMYSATLKLKIPFDASESFVKYCLAIQHFYNKDVLQIFNGLKTMFYSQTIQEPTYWGEYSELALDYPEPEQKYWGCCDVKNKEYMDLIIEIAENKYNKVKVDISDWLHLCYPEMDSISIEFKEIDQEIVELFKQKAKHLTPRLGTTLF